jgi:molecular chaperone DnaK (HSP70)
MPSVVAYAVPPNGRTLVGGAAAARRALAPGTTVHDSKRLLGLAADHPRALEEAAHLPYGVVPEPGDQRLAALALEGVTAPVTLRDVATLLLRALKTAAERSRPVAHALGFQFASATVSVPVGFGRDARAETLRAGRAAGFRLVRLLEEPVAAAIAHGLHLLPGERTVLVYDMGGGTLDVALLRLERISRTFLVLSTAGDARLGGEDFDRALARWATEAAAARGVPLPTGPGPRAQLLLAVEAAKRALSSHPEGVHLALPGGGAVVLSEAEAAAAVEHLLARATAPIAAALEAAALDADDVDDVVLVGGASQLAAVRARVAAAFGGRRLHTDTDPDTAIAVGAARAYNC